VLVLSASGEQQDVLDAIKAGAAGYLTKSAGRDGVPRRGAPHGRRGGGLHARPGRAGAGGVPAAGRDAARRRRTAPSLTERETEVLRLVAKGLSYKQIAERLVLSHRTVQNHVQNTLGKLQLHNRVELVRYAIEQGLDD
jgi:DNA-binding NarL/FixJ family response regulator